tara:strand:- start:452 stop:679 length:228 start_codon:yes stop_codon:yes gene_type:complete
MLMSRKEHKKSLDRLRAIVNQILRLHEKETDEVQTIINNYVDRKIGGRKALGMIQTVIQRDAEHVKEVMKANPIE